jgi:hypothetical protein
MPRERCGKLRACRSWGTLEKGAMSVLEAKRLLPPPACCCSSLCARLCQAHTCSARACGQRSL